MHDDRFAWDTEPITYDPFRSKASNATIPQDGRMHPSQPVMAQSLIRICISCAALWLFRRRVISQPIVSVWISTSIRPRSSSNTATSGSDNW
jgi:hypothetical protein